MCAEPLLCAGIRLTPITEEIKAQLLFVQSLSHVRLFSTPWTAAHQANLSSTIFQSLLKLMSLESMMPSNHLILYYPLPLLPSIFPSISTGDETSVLASPGPGKVFFGTHQSVKFGETSGAKVPKAGAVLFKS